MSPIPASSHVTYGYDDSLAYDDGDPKATTYADDLGDRADRWADE